MSYCVKCGVELDEGAERCPLCGTPAWKPDETEPRYFPTGKGRRGRDHRAGPPPHC